MSVTIFAVLFLVMMLAITYFGYRFMFRATGRDEGVRLERCSVCRASFPKARLIERQAGDTRVYRFCDSCIRGLYQDLLSRN
jgi:hypothetical protein